MGCWQGVLNCNCECLAALQKPVVRFKDSVQEFRYEPSSGLLPTVNVGRYARRALERSLSWRATKTLDGRRYFYNTSKTEYCWELPEEVRATGSEDLGVGDEVEVFCHTDNVWCPGYVERRTDTAVAIAFQRPGAPSSEWVKKELYPGHPDMRSSKNCSFSSSGSLSQKSTRIPRLAHADTGPPATPCSVHPAGGFIETDLPANWTADEQETYDAIFVQASEEVDGNLDVHAAASYFDQAGLEQVVLDGIWQVANPDLKESLGHEEFRAFCRLVAHCQALADAAARSEGKRPAAMRRGGGRLRSMLRERCLPRPPSSPPRLRQKPGVLPPVASGDVLDLTAET
mmetsp:Transcript_17340/g.52270  ORF Transcript_17340/g.52270 Transcript_17340/m.52270 type:complete len:343 (-) Transcript_17340:207-1235(-)|eukprot:CAMPEP_0175211578 /NCGR_PEP_ID=MMETSP0093-20121207/15233_1 /TAXON_ID=311494 /ORGANISM="Alexandrium monilatum, Strain CCMP3105" /LENGTH=342 /DNA_ID=CAMNT_0016504843 /DNA_START=136 /DNA_END=1164 /DNA_ORIENTATION=-